MTEKQVRFQVTGVLELVGWRHDYHDLCSLSRCRGLQQLGDRATPRSSAMATRARCRDNQSQHNARGRTGDYGDGLHGAVERQQVEQLNQYFRTLQAILGGIGAIALLVAAFGIANTMLVAS